MKKFNRAEIDEVLEMLEVHGNSPMFRTPQFQAFVHEPAGMDADFDTAWGFVAACIVVFQDMQEDDPSTEKRPLVNFKEEKDDE